MLRKSQIFSFTLILAIFFIVGIFVFNNSNQIDSEVFTASVSGSILGDETSPILEEDEELSQELEETVLVQTPELSTQDILDDIQEKLDTISLQVQELIAQQNFNLDVVEDLEEPEEELEKNELENDEEGEENELPAEEITCIGSININTAPKEDLDKIIGIGPVTAQKIIDARPFYSLDDLLKVNGIGETTLRKIKEQNCAYVENINGSGGGGSGGGSAEPPAIIYPKILISEVQISSIDQRFVELYNPNSERVDLTGWYLQRKDSNDDSWSSLVSAINFEGKFILANGYFLISREITNSDILLNITLSQDNSLALKNPNREISDKLGFGVAQEHETSPTINPDNDKSIGRKFVDSTEQDTDNNSVDFDLDSPTPKAENVEWVEPLAPIDTTAPEVSFNLLLTQSSLSFDVNFTITDPIATVTPSGLASFIFRWQEEGLDWQEDASQEILGAPLSINLIKTVNGSDGQVFNFQVKAIDVAGNTSEWIPANPATTTITLPVVLKPILINEIQISPIAQRFVEFYNPNDQTVDLTGYYLQRKTKTASSWSSLVSSNNFEGKSIPAGGYFFNLASARRLRYFIRHNFK